MIKGTIQGHAFHGQARKQQCQNSISFTFPLPGRSILQISESFIEVSKFSFNFFRSFFIEIPIFYISYILFIQNVYLDRERTEKTSCEAIFERHYVVSLHTVCNTGMKCVRTDVHHHVITNFSQLDMFTIFSQV